MLLPFPPHVAALLFSSFVLFQLLHKFTPPPPPPLLIYELFYVASTCINTYTREQEQKMALEAVAFPPDLFGCAMKDLLSFGELAGDWSCCYDLDQKSNYDGWDMSQLALPSSSSVLPTIDMTEHGSGGVVVEEKSTAAASATAATVVERKKRPRSSTGSCKDTDEVENQRMTHIAVERNRRRLMNEYLAVLRSIMPPSYVQRGDQASIVGGAINFVKELEQLLQSLNAQRRLKLMTQYPTERSSSSSSSSSSTPFSDFFTFPQYSSASPRCANGATVSPVAHRHETTAKNHSTVADIEVTMVESHANLKVLSRQRPRQLLKMVVGLQNLRLTTLHLNVTTVHRMVLYSFSLKLEDDCHFTSVDDIATAVHHIVGKIQEEAELLQYSGEICATNVVLAKQSIR